METNRCFPWASPVYLEVWQLQVLLVAAAVLADAVNLLRVVRQITVAVTVVVRVVVVVHGPAVGCRVPVVLDVEAVVIRVAVVVAIPAVVAVGKRQIDEVLRDIVILLDDRWLVDGLLDDVARLNGWAVVLPLTEVIVVAQEAVIAVRTACLIHVERDSGRWCVVGSRHMRHGAGAVGDDHESDEHR